MSLPPRALLSPLHLLLIPSNAANAQRTCVVTSSARALELRRELKGA